MVSCHSIVLISFLSLHVCVISGIVERDKSSTVGPTLLTTKQKHEFDHRDSGNSRVNSTSLSNRSELRVHIVPHSHDDSGWLKTFLEYYWGDQQHIQAAGVQYILDAVVDALMQDDRRRFSYAEMSFFMTWWKQQDEGKKDIVRELVKQQRLDFVNGGFVQHDEASAHYVAMIDQTTRGHRFLREEFGFVPRVGWQIDPFGHSSTQAGLLGSDLGFDALFFGRADWEDMQLRKKTKSLEFVWQGSGGSPKECNDGNHDYGSADGLFVGNFASGNYGPPEGFNFEQSISDTPLQDDPMLRGYNVPERVASFIQRCEDLAAVTRGADIMFTMGSDFHYSAASSWFKNLDKLIDAVNEYSIKNGSEMTHKISVFYSTPHEYVKAKASYGDSWPVKVDDFFPYSDAVEAFWTGYYTSRSTSKRYIRHATSFLQAARHLEAFVRLNAEQTRCVNLRGERVLSTDEKGLEILEEAVSLCQHHDSITGTEKQAVADDYHLWIHTGILQAQEVVAEAFQKLMLGNDASCSDENTRTSSFTFCNLLNISICDPSINYSADGDQEDLMVTVYNPASFRREIPIFVPISLERAESWEVIGPDGIKLTSNIIRLSKSTKKLQRYHYGGKEIPKPSAEANIVFLAPIEGLGYAAYAIRPVWDRASPSQSSNEKFSISNEYLTVNFDARSGRVSSIVQDGESIPFSIDLMWYNSSDGLHSSVNKGQSSGAYIFRPNGKVPLLPNDRPVSLDIVHGEVVSEARQMVNSWGSLTIRLYKGKRFLEVEWTIGPFPDDDIGREVAIVYGTSSKIKSDGSFWTDANGRSMIRRLRNKRLSWDSEWAFLDAANYYPMTSAAYIQDKDLSLSVVTDRSHGVASFQDGEVEIMLHRKTVVDDQRGVGEPLNEQQCVGTTCVGLISRGKHWIQFSTPEFAAVQRRQLQQEMIDDPIVAFSLTPLKANTKIVKSHSFLPENAQINFPLHVLTMKVERQRDDDHLLLLRLAHQMDTPEGAVRASVAASALVDLVKNIGCDLIDTKEVSLSTNQEVGDMKRLRFSPGEVIGNVTCSGVFGSPPGNNHHPAHKTRQADENSKMFTKSGDIHLDPMQIRTFEVRCAGSMTVQ